MGTPFSKGTQSDLRPTWVPSLNPLAHTDSKHLTIIHPSALRKSGQTCVKPARSADMIGIQSTVGNLRHHAPYCTSTSSGDSLVAVLPGTGRLDRFRFRGGMAAYNGSAARCAHATQRGPARHLPNAAVACGEQDRASDREPCRAVHLCLPPACRRSARERRQPHFPSQFGQRPGVRAPASSIHSSIAQTLFAHVEPAGAVAALRAGGDTRLISPGSKTKPGRNIARLFS